MIIHGDKYLNTEIKLNGLNENLIARTFTIQYPKKAKRQFVNKSPTKKDESLHPFLLKPNLIL